MGQIAKPVGTETTRYYWYPGERIDWVRAGLAVLAGLFSFAVAGLFSRSMLVAVTTGGSVTAVLAGVNFGRRDFRGMRDFPELARVAGSAGRAGPTGSAGRAGPTGAAARPGPGRGDDSAARRARAARRAAVQHASRAAWRGTVQGVGGALIALLIANLSQHGAVADWLLPIIPVLLGALAHQAGMLYERISLSPPPELPPVPAKATGPRAARTPEGDDRPAAAATRTTGPALRLTSYRGVPPTDPRH